MRRRALSRPDHAPLLAFSISSVTEPNIRVKDHPHRETMIAGVEPAPGSRREGICAARLFGVTWMVGACGIGSAHSRENLRSVSRMQAYIAKLETSYLRQVHRASIVLLLYGVGG